MSYTYDYPRPMVTVDAVVLHPDPAGTQVLLVQRANDPFAGRWALPGGFIEMDETLAESVARELREETGIEGLAFRQLAAFGDPGRDPRGRSVTIVHLAIVEHRNMILRAADDAVDAQWFPCTALPQMAFDHAEIVTYAIEHTHRA